MKILKDIYLKSHHVRESMIPDKWKESFNQFMMGGTCQVDLNEDGSFKEFVYYHWDFARWYVMNEAAIERDIKIEEIIEESKGK